MKYFIIASILLTVAVIIKSNVIPNVDKRSDIIGGDPCTWGPSFWCENKTNAERCHAEDVCKMYHRQLTTSQFTKMEPLGKNPCTWGPSFWCENETNTQRCNAEIFCSTYHKAEKTLQSERFEMLKHDPCTWGPSYWCASKENAESCHTQKWCDTHGSTPIFENGPQ